MKSGLKKGKTIVSVEETNQDRETGSRYGQVESSIWTERMLAALKRGIKGGRWFSLIDKVYSMKNLKLSWRKVKTNRGGAGIDKQSIENFSHQEEKYLAELHEELKSGRYEPKGIKRKWIPKPGKKEKRPLGIPTVKDRIVQTAIRNVIEPIFEKEFYKHSYGFRPKRGCKDALRRVHMLLKEGHRWVVDVDIKDYFGIIDHEILMKEIERRIADGTLLKLIKRYLKQEIVEECRTWTSESGTPQGAVISPLLANIYLDVMDKEMERRGYELVRYADDFVMLAQTEEKARECMMELEEILGRQRLTIHPEKSRIVDMEQPEGFDFLGYHFVRSRHKKGKVNKLPSKKSLNKFKDRIREKTKRTNGHSMEKIIEDVNKTAKGWFEYFKQSHKWTFPLLDQWIRMRLRTCV